MNKTCCDPRAHTFLQAARLLSAVVLRAEKQT